MAYLVDTNILLRNLEPKHPLHAKSVGAVAGLIAAKETVCTVPQVITELWNVCTRPIDVNGLGMTVAETDAELQNIESLITIMPESPKIFDEWRRLVNKYSVKGKQVHDARIAAAMKIHGVENIVTFNDGDFKRFSGIRVFTPADIIANY